MTSKYGFSSIFNIIFDQLLNNDDELFVDTNKKEEVLSECLYWACEMNHLDIVKLIIPHIEYVSPKNFGGRYGEFVDPIMKPLQNGYLGIIWWYFQKFSVDISCFCIPSRYRHDCEKYPLYVAVENGKYNIVQYLLEKGAEIDQINDDRLITALYRAFELEDEEMIELLLRFGADYENVKLSRFKTDVQERFTSVISTVLTRIQKKNMQISVKLFVNTKYADVFFAFVD